jgi:5-hydroxyisourate hydrolase
MSPLTIHVLDTSTGLPASGVKVELARHEGGVFVALGERSTDADGRVRDFLAAGQLAQATYRLRFFTEPYFTASGRSSFFPWVDVVFTVQALDRHHHVPLLVSPFGYATYRGS